MKKAILALLALAVVAIVTWRAYQLYQSKAAAAANPSSSGRSGGGGRGGPLPTMRVPLVDSVSAKEALIEDRVSLIGSLRPLAEVQVMSKISGRVEKITVDVGDTVRRGDLIAQVEDREILQQIQQAEASIGVARASIQQREAELANFTRQVGRYRDLHEQNLISRQDLDEVLTRQQTSEAQLELSKAQLRQSEASLAQLKISLENTRSFSPMDGLVGKRFLHPGALVSANTPIVNLVDLRTLRMIVNMVEKDLVRVGRGASVAVAVDAFPGRSYSGKILRASPVLDPATRTGEVEIQVANQDLSLRAEMFARVTLNLGGQRKGLLLPREAVVYRGEQSGVFLLEESRARFRPVEIGYSLQDSVEIRSGIALGEKVISMGASLLKDGDQVRMRGEGPGRGASGEGAPSGGAPRKKRG